MCVVLTDPLQTSLHEALDVGRIQGQPEVEHFGVVAMVIPYRCPAREGIFAPPPIVSAR